MKKLITSILFLSMVSVIVPFVFPRARKNLILYVGETTILSVDNPERIVISEPEVLEVIKATQKEVTLMGKSEGKTSFTWWDKKGEHHLSVEVYQEDIIEVKDRIDELIEKVGISNIETVALDKENKILLQGEVKDIKDKERLLLALGELKAKIVDLIVVREEEASVEIEVQVLELTSDAAKTLGFTVPYSVTIRESPSTPGYSPRTYFRIPPLSRTSFSWTLDLLESQGKAKILSRPRLTCRSGREAKLTVGGEVPILTTELTEYGAERTEVEYKEYGITLKIKPTVIDRKKIDINLDVEISEIGEAEVLGLVHAPTAKAYPLIKRTFSTALSLDDGATLSIGGLIKKKSEEDIKKFPWLADIPILGFFFRQEITTSGGGKGKRGDSELYITLTPRIILSPQLFPQEERTTEIEDLGTEILRRRKIVEQDEKADVFSLLQRYIIEKYKKDLHQKILKNISLLPSVSTAEKIDLVLSLKVSSAGKVKKVQIVQSSGNKTFDEEVLTTIRSLSYPPFPVDMRLEEIVVQIPIVYQSQK